MVLDMYKKLVKFLLVVVVCLVLETVAILWCFNSYVNNNRVEKGSVFVNLIAGWKALGKEVDAPKNLDDYIEPFAEHFIYITKDAKGTLVYGHKVGEKYYTEIYKEGYDENGEYYETWDWVPAKDAAGKDLYVKANERFYYASSTNHPNDYMYAKELGDQYFIYATDGNMELLTNETGGKVLSGPQTEIPTEDVTFDKDAKFYYIIVLASGALSVSSMIGLAVVSILNKKKALSLG